MEKLVIKKAMMIAVTRKERGSEFPKHILMESDAVNGEKIEVIAKRLFEKYKKTQTYDDIILLSYSYYGDVEVPM